MEVECSTSCELLSKLSRHSFNITFVDEQENLVSGWQGEIEKQLPLPQHGASPSISLSTYLGSFQSYLKSTIAECVVSPANSFGLMDGGLDLALSKYYGGVANLVPIVRRALVDEWCGEQNVGTCLIVDVHELVERAKQGGQVVNVPRYIAHVPTMRVPKHLQPEGDIPYCCTWALLTAVRKHNAEVARLVSRGGCDCYCDAKQERINNVICAGFGTGAGRFPLEECARQMVLAVKHFAEKTSNYFTEADGVPRTTDPSGLLTLWDEAEKVEDAVSSSIVENVQQPSSLFEKMFGKYPG